MFARSDPGVHPTFPLAASQAHHTPPRADEVRGSWRKWSSARTGKTRSRGLRKVPEGHLWQRGVEALATQAELFGDVRERVRQLQRRAEDSLRTGMRANLGPAAGE